MPANFAAIAKVIASATATHVGPNIERAPYATVERMLGNKLSAADRKRFKNEWEGACDNWFISHSEPSVQRDAGLIPKRRRVKR